MAQSDNVMFYCGQRMMRLETLSVAIDFTNIISASLAYSDQPTAGTESRSRIESRASETSPT
jgi:hypothetical protein